MRFGHTKPHKSMFSNVIHNFLEDRAFVLALECYPKEIRTVFVCANVRLPSRGRRFSAARAISGRMILDDKNPVSLRCDFDAAADLPAIEAVDLVEISGRVKWFDVVKGYGFIVPDNGGPDVLLHIATLRKDGFKIRL